MKKLKTYLLFFLLLVTARGYTQVYPVQAFVQLSPPYTGYLPDYADPFSEQMKILLTLNDFSVPSYDVKIRLSITGSGFSMQTKPYAVFAPITLTPGQPLQISGSDLAPYLSSTNLDFTGVNVADYETRRVLPEGMYSVCVQVLDYYNTGTILANSGCAQAWFALHEPPLLNTPFCGTQVTPMNPQVVLFNWSPLHMSSPGAAFNTEYDFELFEVRPGGANPNVVMTTTVPIFTQTTNMTFINYGITEPPLQTGMQYVWRVKARMTDGRDAFKNNGYSQPCTFTYGNIAETVVGNVTLTLTANGMGPRLGLTSWNASASFTHYTLEVRKVNGASATWFPYNSTTGTLKVGSLEPETEYEARVKGHTGTFESEWSNTVTFTTLPLPDYACNSTSLPPVEGSVPALKNLPVGAIVNTGQFEMTVLQVNQSLPGGRYTGYGKIYVPFALMTLNVYFEKILIDENLAMRDGRVVVLTQGIEQWANQMLNAHLGLSIDYQYTGNIDTLIFQNGNLIIFDDGQQIIIELPNPMTGNYIIQDADGTIFVVHPDGTIIHFESNIQITLTELEKNIIRMSLQNLAHKFDDDTLQYLKNQEQMARASLPSEPSAQAGAPPFLFRKVGTTGENILEGAFISDHNTYHTLAQNNLIGRTSRHFADVFLDSENFSFIAYYTKVSGKDLRDYIAESIAAGNSAEQIAAVISTVLIHNISVSVKNALHH